MTEASAEPASTTVWNVPNVLTFARMGMSVVLFVLLALGFYWASLVVFSLAAFTDYLDGWWARTFQQQTVLGRIIDPLADKLVICGSVIFLAAVEDKGSQIAPWMAVTLVGRELVVTALRSLVEERGIDFSASLAGKIKMVVQVAAVAGSLIILSLTKAQSPDWLIWTVLVLVWAALAVTLYSAGEYILAAIRILATTID
jgi:CDP-diacylglycerol--glycerol-3-phosphate 3-phosphatidyltransferase